MLKTTRIPPFLKQGQRVALVSPAGCIEPACLERGVSVLESWGLQVEIGAHALKHSGPFAGTDEERLADLQAALDDPEIRAVICTRGGYGTVRLIDRLDFSAFLQNPKWIVGFSDITVLLSHLQENLGVASLHACMPQTYPAPESPDYAPSVGTLKQALFGEALVHHFPNHPLNRAGSVFAPIIGGNLSMLYSLRATDTDIDPRGKILFLEDLDEFDYHIDRMLMNLARSGWFERIAGLVAGTFTKIKKGAHPYSCDVWNILHEYVAPYEYPVCFDFPAGHVPYSHALYMGIPACLEVKNSSQTSSQLSFRF